MLVGCVDVCGIVSVVNCCLIRAFVLFVVLLSSVVGDCDFCLISDPCSWRCSFMGSVCVGVWNVPICNSEYGVLCYL